MSYVAIRIEDDSDEAPKLTAKAKGKQRAVDDSEDTVQSHLFINIRFTQAVQDLLGVRITPELTVRDFKRQVKYL